MNAQERFSQCMNYTFFFLLLYFFIFVNNCNVDFNLNRNLSTNHFGGKVIKY